MSDDDKTSGGEAASYKRKPIGAFAILSPELYTNPKVRRAGRNGREVFVFALARNAARGRTGEFQASDLDHVYLADMLRISEDEAREGLDRAEAAGLLAFDGDRVRIVGWDETWARKALNETDARQQRREAERKTKTETESKTKSKTKTDRQTQTQSKSSPGDARTVTGLRVCVPPPSKAEADEARQLIANSIGVNFATGEEAGHAVALIRSGTNAEYLRELGWYLISDEGAGWWNRTSPEGDFYMRQHLNVSTAFSDKTIAKHLAAAMSFAADQRKAAEDAAKADAAVTRENARVGAL